MFVICCSYYELVCRPMATPPPDTPATPPREGDEDDEVEIVDVRKPLQEWSVDLNEFITKQVQENPSLAVSATEYTFGALWPKAYEAIKKKMISINAPDMKPRKKNPWTPKVRRVSDRSW